MDRGPTTKNQEQLTMDNKQRKKEKGQTQRTMNNGQWRNSQWSMDKGKRKNNKEQSNKEKGQTQRTMDNEP